MQHYPKKINFSCFKLNCEAGNYLSIGINNLDVSKYPLGFVFIEKKHRVERKDFSGNSCKNTSDFVNKQI